MNRAYGRADGDVLLAPERDARTGRRVPSRQSRRDKRRKRPRVRTRPLTTALVAGAAVVALGVGVAVAASGGNGKKHLLVANGPATNSGPVGGTSGASGPKADFVRVLFGAPPTLARNTGQFRNIPAREVVPYLEFLCRAKGCEFILHGSGFFVGDELDIKDGPVSLQPANGHWHIDMHGTRSACTGESHTAVGILDLSASGTSEDFGVTHPARITGTFTFNTTAEADSDGFVCNAASHVRATYDSPSDSVFPTDAGGINAVPPAS